MHHGKRRSIIPALAAALFATAAPVFAEYAGRPIEIVSPVPAGGNTDAVARAFAESARKDVPQQTMPTQSSSSCGPGAA
ncbi:hypothetical protein D5044_19180 [Verminephrobacter eiseniae]|nr:hypothetical protein [Verminephrobacter eiseniae]